MYTSDIYYYTVINYILYVCVCVYTHTHCNIYIYDQYKLYTKYEIKILKKKCTYKMYNSIL